MIWMILGALATLSALTIWSLARIAALSDEALERERGTGEWDDAA
jgi:hypothetical protein